ncbi:MAG TPA: M13 family metallopeptidase [Candidatus Paceibacterota bacterium]
MMTMDIPKPGDDFFNFVNGKWIEENPIPPEESRWGSFYALRVEVEKQIKAILDGVATKSDADLDDNARKVRDFYRTGMDTEKLDALKDAPLKNVFTMIDGVSEVAGLSPLLGTLHRQGISVFWGCGVDQDLKNSDIMALYFGQDGLSLPDRDYYLNDDEKSREVRAKYSTYADRMLSLSSAIAKYEPVQKVFIDIETRLAKASMTQVELRDIEKQYNKMTPVELAAISPRVDWGKYFEAMKAPVPEYMIVCQPEFMKVVNSIFEEVALEDIKAYVRWRALNGTANFLNEDFTKEVFDFYGRTFGGATEMKPRWRRVLSVVDNMLDEAVGQLYIKEHFSEAAKEKIKDLVEHLTAAYKTRIKNLDWMSVETREKALAKLATVTKKLGYPDKWKDFSALEIGTDSYLQNYVRAHVFEFDRRMKKIAKPVDRSEWHCSPQTVNAFYSPPMNEITFPAAILQPPFFYEDIDDAMNFGGIGTFIGHELTHGFDDQGALFDPHGNLQNWWTKEDKDRFDERTTHLAEQFDAYEPLPGLHVNGKLTLGENIADLGGLLIAYDGLVLALGGQEAAAKAPVVEGMTPFQRFFKNLAIAERANLREEALRTQIQTDPHSPGFYRVNGPLSNMVEFYEAFDVKPGDKLYREESDRVKIW